jgi:cytosine/uracil/thiamine/allantoin permease
MATPFVIMFAVNYTAVLRPVIGSAVNRAFVINRAVNINRLFVVNRRRFFIIGRINYPAGLVTNMYGCALPLPGPLQTVPKRLTRVLLSKI